MLAAVGRMKNGPERDLLRRYLDRAKATGRAVGIADVTEIELEESRARDVGQRRREEALSLRTRFPGSTLVLLDEHARSRSSIEIARMVEKARDASQTACVFVVGGPDGLAPDLLADHVSISFGAATFPHQLVRVLVAEQIYRAITILAGHPYHRE